MAKIIEQDEWAEQPGRWHGEWQGGASGAGISVIFVSLDEPGGGPRLHRHPYSETFIVRRGTGRFTLGDQEIIATEGQILIAPANMPHKFTNVGPGPLETIDIHSSGKFMTEWLE